MCKGSMSVKPCGRVWVSCPAGRSCVVSVVLVVPCRGRGQTIEKYGTMIGILRMTLDYQT